MWPAKDARASAGAPPGIGRRRGEAVKPGKHAGLAVEPEILAHVSPLGWAHILLTGEYRWPKRRYPTYRMILPPTGVDPLPRPVIDRVTILI